MASRTPEDRGAPCCKTSAGKKQPPGAFGAAGREHGCAWGAPTPVPPPSTAPRRPPRARRDTPPGGGGRSASGRLRASSRFGGWGVSAPPAGRGAHSIVLVPHPVKQPPPRPVSPRIAPRSAPRERTCTAGAGRCSPRWSPPADPGKVCAGRQAWRTANGPHPARSRLATLSLHPVHAKREAPFRERGLGFGGLAVYVVPI